jgi:hypothetical protein
MRTLVVRQIDLPIRAGLPERKLGRKKIAIVETVAAELHGVEISTERPGSQPATRHSPV